MDSIRKLIFSLAGLYELTPVSVEGASIRELGLNTSLYDG